MSDDWTIVDLINTTKAFFEKKGIVDAARLDAELLLADVLGCSRIDLYVQFDRRVGDPQLSRFRERVRERGERRPVKQILGRCEFMSHPFAITPDVLTPRPETETVVEEALGCLGDGPRTVVDIGTGSGCIAISLALGRPDATVYATDISEPALAVARANAEQHNVAERVALLPGDLFAPLAGRGLDGRVDCIVSNPPYVSESELAGLMPEVAEYEPRVALVSGEDGMAHTRRILVAAPDYLRPGGALVVETSPGTAERARAAAESHDAYAEARTVRDLAHVERVLIATKET